MDVLLVARKSGDWNDRIVIAITEGEARYLHEQHRLDGWTPA